MKNRQTTFFVTGVLAVALGGLVAHWALEDRTDTPIQLPSSRKEPAPRMADKGVSASTQAVAPTPSANTDTELAVDQEPVSAAIAGRRHLLDSYAQLRALSDAGNADAAYQLFLDFQKCVMAGGRAATIESATAKAGTESAINRAAEVLEGDFEFCREVSNDLLAERIEWLTRAARGGNLAAKAAFPAFAFDSFRDEQDILARADEFAAVRREAQQHLREAAAAGNNEALGLLADQSEFGGPLFQRDPIAAYVYNAALYHQRGSAGFLTNMERIQATFTAQQTEEANRRAQAFINQCCNDQ